jgi:putative endonuclease
MQPGITEYIPTAKRQMQSLLLTCSVKIQMKSNNFQLLKTKQERQVQVCKSCISGHFHRIKSCIFQLSGEQKVRVILYFLVMNYTVYILFSQKLNRYYVVQTQNFEERIKYHLLNEFSGSFTTKADDWQVYFTIPCESRIQVLQIESHIKRLKSKNYIGNLRKHDSIVIRLKEMYPEVIGSTPMAIGATWGALV